MLGLLDCVNAGTWSDDGTGTAAAALIAMGVDGDLAVTRVRSLRGPSAWASRPQAHIPRSSRVFPGEDTHVPVPVR